MSGPIVLTICVALMAAPGKKSWADEMNAGKDAHAAMNLEGALKRFQRALQLTTSVEEKVQTRLWLGITQCELGEFKACDNEFLEALELDESVALPIDVPPKTRGIFEGAKLKLAPPPLPPDPPAEPAPQTRAEPVVEPNPTPLTIVEEKPASVNWLLLGGGAVMLSSALVAATAFFLDVGAGPEMLDGGPASNAAYGASAVLLIAGGAVAIAGFIVE